MRPSRPLSLAALALVAAAVTVPACLPSTPAPEGEGVDTNGAQVTGNLPVGTVLVATTNVNLRKGPGSSYAVVDVVQSGDTVTVAASAPKNGYYEVRYGGEVGWSYGKYFALASSGSASSGAGTASASSSSSGGAGGSGSSSAASSSSSSGALATLVATANVNLRSGPGTSYAILDVVPSGSTVTLLDPNEQNGFYNIAYQSETGWSSASYLQPSQSSGSSSGGATTWSCTGSYGTTKMADGEYYATEFGCYLDSNHVAHQDPGDNCIPTCLSQAQASGLCAGMDGPTCEESVAWYAADGARFGCLARLKVTNPLNGKAVVVVALDYGPACSVEDTVSHAAIDLSYPADAYLFGGETGISDKALVHVDEVPASTPLGPVQ